VAQVEASGGRTGDICGWPRTQAGRGTSLRLPGAEPRLGVVEPKAMEGQCSGMVVARWG
jgi:hypothetical protein